MQQFIHALSCLLRKRIQFPAQGFSGGAGYARRARYPGKLLVQGGRVHDRLGGLPCGTHTGNGCRVAVAYGIDAASQADGTGAQGGEGSPPRLRKPGQGLGILAGAGLQVPGKVDDERGLHDLRARARVCKRRLNLGRGSDSVSARERPVKRASPSRARSRFAIPASVSPPCGDGLGMRE